MKITLNGTKHTIPDDSTHVAVDKNGEAYIYNLTLAIVAGIVWNIHDDPIRICVMNPPPADFTKCCAKVFDGAVIDFEGM